MAIRRRGARAGEHVGDRVAENAVWTYEEPLPAAAWLRGLVSVYPERMDAWFDEDEAIQGHLRDPDHRVDARRSSRRVEVRADGDVVARSERPVVVFETGNPLRFYIPREDADAALVASATTTACPYTGVASYWSLGDVEDAASSYEEPLEAMTKAAGFVSVDAAKVEVLEVA